MRWVWACCAGEPKPGGVNATPSSADRLWSIRLSAGRPRHQRRACNLAEAVRFELTDGFPSPVFKFTVELNQIKSLADFRLRNLPNSSADACPAGCDSSSQLRRAFPALPRKARRCGGFACDAQNVGANASQVYSHRSDAYRFGRLQATSEEDLALLKQWAGHDVWCVTNRTTPLSRSHARHDPVRQNSCD